MSERPSHIPPFNQLSCHHYEGIKWWYVRGGKSCAEIGAQVARSGPGVRNLLERLGVELRRPGKRAVPSEQQQDKEMLEELRLVNEVSLGVVRMLLAVNCSRRLRGAPTVHYVDLAAEVDAERNSA